MRNRLGKKALETFGAWGTILLLGSIAVALGSFPLAFRYVFLAVLMGLLIAARIVSRLNEYVRVLDALLVLVVLWFIPKLAFYRRFMAAGREFFYLLFGRDRLVTEVANNSLSGLLWIFLPMVLLILERDALKNIFLTKGKKQGWTVGTVLLSALLVAAFATAIASGVRIRTVISFLPLAVVFAIVNAIKEEVLYRGLVFGRTLPFGFGFALVAQFVWFALIHALYSGAEEKGFGMMIGIGVFALLASWMTRRFGSLACAVLTHTGIDLIIFSAGLPH